MNGYSCPFADPAERPYFLWSERTTVGEFRAALARANPAEKALLLGRLLREARDEDVWSFTTVKEVRELLPQIDRYLGRRRAFWHYRSARGSSMGSPKGLLTQTQTVEAISTLKVEDYLELARQKDSGVSPATIAWLVRSMPVPEAVPGGVTKDEVVAWLRSLETRMLALAAPAR